MQRFAVIGAGAWGTALAITAARAGRAVVLWAREAEAVAAVNDRHENPVFLPGVRLPASIRATGDLAAAVRQADAAILVVPSQFLRAVCRDLSPVLPERLPLVICAKGIERETGKLMAAVVEDELPGHPLAVLSGPTFAAEVAADMPTAVTIASEDGATAGLGSLAGRLSVALATPTFRPYVSDDVTGVEIGGAVKNVLAIASGIATGLGFGANTRAALITRGLEEIKRLSEALGGRRDTVTGLAGIGDLALTCSSEQSRNMSFGKALGQGKAAADLLANRASVVEGVENARSVTDLADRLGVDMPISQAVRAIVHEGKGIQETMTALLSRPLKAEPKGLTLDP